MKQEDPLVPKAQSNLTNREIKHQKREGASKISRSPESLNTPRPQFPHLSNGHDVPTVCLTRGRGCSREIRMEIFFVNCQVRSTTRRQHHLTEATHLLYGDPRTKSQKCNQPKVLHICTNSLEFSFISRDVSTFLNFAAPRTKGLLF